jgi:uncharacterized protein YcsI (UPF0317 family)
MDLEGFVTFLLGCSFTFESALLKAGLPVRHLEERGPDGKPLNVPMYRTNIQTTPAGPFHGPLVVSMRPFTPEQAEQARLITSKFSRVHGEPVHIGDPSAIGIEDLSRPDYGDAVTVRDGEVPVFWACGVTPQAAIAMAKPALAITHAPGHMYVCDITNDALMEASTTADVGEAGKRT